MNISTTSAKSKFSVHSARYFIRELWVCINTFNMYGAEHPAAQKGLKKLYDYLKGVLNSISHITIHTEGDNLFFEEWQVDREVDMKRMIARMKDLGIHSITFFKAIRSEDLLELIRIIIDSRKHKELDAVREYLKINKIRGFTFNYYNFKKIPTGGFQVSEYEDFYPEEASVENSIIGKGSPALKLIEEYLRDQSKVFLPFSEKLRSIRTRFESGEGPEIEKLSDLIPSLKMVLEEDYSSAGEVGLSPEEWNSTLAELDSVTISIMSRTVYEALQGEEEQIKGIGDFFRKLDPDLEFSMKVLPQIKKNLATKGISLLQYLNFIQALADEITLKEFKSILKKSGGDIGVTNREIMEEIEKNQEEMIPLTTLAIKLESLISDSSKPMMNYLYQHAEKELREIVMKKISGKKIEKREDIGPYLEESRLALLRKLAERGLILKIVQDLNNLIIRRKETLWGLIWAQHLIETGSPTSRLPGGEELRLLAEKIKPLKDGTSILNAALYVLEEKGLSRELLNRFIKITTGKKTIGRTDKTFTAKTLHLPIDVAGFEETLRYLDMEISRNLRYHTPFSCISISVPGVTTDKQLREPDLNEKAAIFSEITSLLKNCLRNLDFIGSLGDLSENHLFVIMTMTGSEGTLTVAMRLAEGLKGISVEVDGKIISTHVNMSTITFDPEETPDMQSFLRLVKARHRENSNSV